MDPLTSQQLLRFTSLCNEILPAGGGMPAAGTLALELRELPAALGVQPEMESLLLDMLGQCPESVTEDWLEDFWGEKPRLCEQVVTLICAAYYLHPEVRRNLGYPGQQALTPSRGCFGQEDLVIGMMAGPKRFRTVT